MFNLIMRWFDWGDGNASMPLDRLFEYTDNHVADQFRDNGNALLDRIARLPCLFMTEGRGDEVARVGSIIRPRIANREIYFEFVLDADVAPLQNHVVYENRHALDMPVDFEFSRNHWAMKDVDLYRFLFRDAQPRRQRPSVFRLEDHENIEPTLGPVKNQQNWFDP